MRIECLRQHIVSGGKTFPIYIGFAPAAEIARVAVAPAFSRDTPNQQLAENLTQQPVRDWQRPISDERVEKIASTFNNTGALMPNPVLLSNNAFATGITITAKSIDGMPYQTGTFIVEVPDRTEPPRDRPLWILDGQHRISGLSGSQQKNDPVPLVLLLDDGSGSYTSPLLASLFAQVTTAAQKLDDLHNEWLTYAFQLGRYSISQLGHGAAARAFSCVVELCRNVELDGISPNPFFNQIQFNESVAVTPAMGGFSFKCTTLADLIARNYYALPCQQLHLTPDRLAAEIARAYKSLHSTIKDHGSSVFFGRGGKQQNIMQEAFLIGALTRSLRNGTTADYDALLQALNFHNTNWDFAWIVSLGGAANTESKRIAIAILNDALSTGRLPDGTDNLADYFKGDGAWVELVSSGLTAARRPQRNNKQKYRAVRGSLRTVPTATLPHVKVGEKTNNVGEVQILQRNAVGTPQRYKSIEKSGLILESPYPRPLEIVIEMHHYGGLVSGAEVDLSW